MNKAATLTAAVVTAGAVLFATGSAAAPPPPPPTTIELDRGRLVFSSAELFSHVESETNFAVIGGTGSYAGAEGEVTGAPSTVDGQPASHLTFHLSRK